MKLKKRPTLVGVLSLLFFNACSGESANDAFGGADSLLQYVPADTPYLFATGEPVSDELYDKFEPQMDRLLAAYRKLFGESYKSSLSKNTGDMSAEEIARMSAVVDQLLAMLSVEGLRDAGFERDSQAVFYGNGLLPVLRIEVSEAAKFEKALADIEAAAGEKMEVAEIGDTSYRFLGDDELRFVIGQFDGTVIVTLLPTEFSDEQAEVLFGLAPPAKSIASTTTIGDIRDKYKFGPHYLGFVDTMRLASTFVEPASGLNAALVQMADFDPDSISPVCRKEIMAVAGIVPRMVFGYQEISVDEMTGSAVVELRDDIASALTQVAAPVQGLGIDSGALLSFGASLNLMAWRDFYSSRLDAMEADPYECEYFSDLQASVPKGRELLAQQIPPIAYSLRGFNAIIEDLGDYDLASKVPPEKVDASLLFAMKDAQALVAMGAMFSPELAQIGLKTDGVPVSISGLPQVAQMGQEAFAAMLPDALAVSVGNDAKIRAADVLKAEFVSPMPVIALSMDANEYYKLVAQGMAMEPDEEGEEMSPEAQAAAQEIMLILGETYDRMQIDVSFTDNGMEIGSRVTLKD